jgi:hypothetical protein
MGIAGAGDAGSREGGFSAGDAFCGLGLGTYIEDASCKFEWAAPDKEVHAFVNGLERPIET